MMTGKHNYLVRIGSLLSFCLLLAACAKEPPGCGDEKTLALVQGAFWDSLNKELDNYSSQAKTKARQLFELRVESPRIQEKRPEANQIICAAELKATIIGDLGYPVANKERESKVTYSSQMTVDGKQHIVELSNHIALAAVFYGITIEFMNNQERVAAAAKAKAAYDANPAMAKASVNTDELKPSEIAESEFQAADKELNTAYQSTRSKISEAQQIALRDEQRDWIQNRDKTCSRENVFMANQVMSADKEQSAQTVCKMRLTRERTKELSGR